MKEMGESRLREFAKYDWLFVLDCSGSGGRDRRFSLVIVRLARKRLLQKVFPFLSFNF